MSAFCWFEQEMSNFVIEGRLQFAEAGGFAGGPSVLRMLLKPLRTCDVRCGSEGRIYYVTYVCLRQICSILPEYAIMAGFGLHADDPSVALPSCTRFESKTKHLVRTPNIHPPQHSSHGASVDNTCSTAIIFVCSHISSHSSPRNPWSSSSSGCSSRNIRVLKTTKLRSINSPDASAR